MTTTYRISEAAALSGLSAASIRFYEKQNLVSPPERGDNSYRVYTEQQVAQLRLLRLCRAMDMPLDKARALLQLELDCPAGDDHVRALLDEHLFQVRARLQELKLLERQLYALRDRCDDSAMRRPR